MGTVFPLFGWVVYLEALVCIDLTQGGGTSMFSAPCHLRELLSNNEAHFTNRKKERGKLAMLSSSLRDNNSWNKLSFLKSETKSKVLRKSRKNRFVHEITLKFPERNLLIYLPGSIDFYDSTF